MYSAEDQKEAVKRLSHILDFIETIETFVDGKTSEDVEEDRILTLALERVLQNIGEAASWVPEEIRKDYSDIPWRKIIDMRNVLAHGYDDIDAAIVWGTSVSDVQELRVGVQKILKDIDHG